MRTRGTSIRPHPPATAQESQGYRRQGTAPASGAGLGAGREGRAVSRLIDQLDAKERRITEYDPDHLLEASAVIVYDPATGQLRDDLPPPGTGLRLNEFLDTLAAIYRRRFG